MTKLKRNRLISRSRFWELVDRNYCKPLLTPQEQRSINPGPSRESQGSPMIPARQMETFRGSGEIIEEHLETQERADLANHA